MDYPAFDAIDYDPQFDFQRELLEAKRREIMNAFVEAARALGGPVRISQTDYDPIRSVLTYKFVRANSVA